MANKFKDLLQTLKKTKESASSDKLDLLLSQLQEIKTALATIMLQHQLMQVSEIVKKMGDLKKPDSSKPKEETPVANKANLPEALDNLEEITTTKKNVSGRRTYLLHRPTPDFEYEKTAKDGNSYETTKETSWIAEIEAAETQQKDKNPVVSVWVPEDSIARIEGAIDNTGTWDDMGTNPNATKYTVFINPGRYEIYRELRQ